jgi:hypothetical protein
MFCVRTREEVPAFNGPNMTSFSFPDIYRSWILPDTLDKYINYSYL